MASIGGLALAFVANDGGSNWSSVSLLTSTESPALNGIDEYTGSGDTVSSIYETAGNLVSDASSYEDDDLRALFSNLFGQTLNHYYVLFTGSGTDSDIRGTWYDGADILADGGISAWFDGLGVGGTMFNKAFQVQFWVVAKGSVESDTHETNTGKEPEFIGYCDSPLVHLRWDLVDDVDITFDGGTTWYEVASGITTQTELRQWLEAVYPDDDYLFAYHVNTGEICVDWQGHDSGAGGFTFSVALQDTIEIEDSADAWVVRKQDWRNEFSRG